MKKRWMVFHYWLRSIRVVLSSLVALCLAAPALAQTGNSPWENAVNVLQQALTSTIARGLSLVAIVFAMCLGAASFYLLCSLLGGILIFVLLYFVAQWATATDPQILRLLLRAAKLRSQYDPAKLSPVVITRAT